MSAENHRVRALALMSGGLDSQLAVCLLRQQGVEVHAITFESPFFSSLRATKAAEQLDLPLRVINFTPDIVRLLEGPEHGFGSQMNPCIDCHIQMLRRAGDVLEDEGFDFLCTGEVANQRPMSQSLKTLELVARASGRETLVVRPLSAKRLPETEPERRGWIDRERLLDIEGRSRKPQMQLAERLGLRDYPTPAGGCLLTEPNFCVRLRDLATHEGLQGERNLALLRIGRHFRLSQSTKFVVGRNEKDNAVLEGTAELYDLLLKTEGVPGPTGLLPFTAAESEIQTAAAICARYSDCPREKEAVVRLRSSRGTKRLEVTPASSEESEQLRI
jgi:tRNA U34 2-thiouridine synthase MnmA/TrmU